MGVKENFKFFGGGCDQIFRGAGRSLGDPDTILQPWATPGMMDGQAITKALPRAIEARPFRSVIPDRPPKRLLHPPPPTECCRLNGYNDSKS